MPVSLPVQLLFFFVYFFFFPLLGQRIRLSFRGKHAEFPAKCGRKEARAAGENCQTVVTSAPVCRWLMTVIFCRIRWPDWHERDPHRLLYINGTTVATRDAAQLPCLLLRHQLRPSTRNTVTRRRISADLGFPWNHSSQGVCLHIHCHLSKITYVDFILQIELSSIFIEIIWRYSIYHFEFNNDYYDNHDEYFLLINYSQIFSDFNRFELKIARIVKRLHFYQEQRSSSHIFDYSNLLSSFEHVYVTRAINARSFNLNNLLLSYHRNLFQGTTHSCARALVQSNRKSEAE